MSSTKSAIILLTCLLGTVANLNYIGSNSNFLMKEGPTSIYFVLAASGLITLLVFNFFRKVKLKFSKTLLYSLGALFAAVTVLQQMPDDTRAHSFVWFGLSAILPTLLRWMAMELATRHLNPISQRYFLPALLGAFEGGTIIAVILLRSPYYDLSFSFTVTQFILVAVGLLIGALFVSKRHPEYKLTRNKATAAESASEVAALVRPQTMLYGVVILSFFFAVLKSLSDVSAMSYYKSVFTDSAQVRTIIGNVYLFSSTLIILFTIGVNWYQQTRKLSPFIILFGYSAIALGAFTLGVTMPQVYLWMSIDILFRSSDRLFFNIAKGNIFGFFPGSIVGWIRPYQELFYGTIGLLFTAAVSKLFWLDIGQELKVILYLLVVTGTVISVLSLRKRIGDYVEKAIFAQNKLVSIPAIQGLSFFGVGRFTEDVSQILKTNPKKLIRKTIIFELSYTPSVNTFELLKAEFASEKEEIQLAVIDALRLAKTNDAIHFLLKTMLAKKNVRSFKVRANAAAIIASTYGRKAIPFLLEGLDDEDHRVVANTIEVLSQFKDKDLLHHYLKFTSSPIPRLKANALYAIRNTKKYKPLFRQEVLGMLTSGDANQMSSCLYLLGKNRNTDFAVEIDSLPTGPDTDPMILRNLAWFQVNTGSPKGFQYFFDKLTAEVTDVPTIEATLHFFAQLDPRLQYKILEKIIAEAKVNLIHFNRLMNNLKLSHYDFHEEIDFVRSQFES